MRLDEVDPFDHHVLRVRKGDRMRPSVEIALAVCVVIPDLSIAVESPVTMSIEMDIGASKVPGRCLVLKANRDGVGEPVRNVIIIPAKRSSKLHIDIVKTGRIHDGEDVVGRV